MSKFLSTLSLRRATTIFAVRPYDAPIFLSTLSLRRATTSPKSVIYLLDISIHALLAESDIIPISMCVTASISIHALLAESDQSPNRKMGRLQPFLSTLSLRRATDHSVTLIPHQQISIHALLAESDTVAGSCRNGVIGFLSTLSLRRATWQIPHALRLQ